jgi:hypothetical protein
MDWFTNAVFGVTKIVHVHRVNGNLRLLSLVQVFSKSQLFRIIRNNRLRKSDGMEEMVQTEMSFILPRNGKESAPLTSRRIDDSKFVTFKGSTWSQ